MALLGIRSPRNSFGLRARGRYRMKHHSDRMPLWTNVFRQLRASGECVSGHCSHSDAAQALYPLVVSEVLLTALRCGPEAAGTKSASAVGSRQYLLVEDSHEFAASQAVLNVDHSSVGKTGISDPSFLIPSIGFDCFHRAASKSDRAES